MENKEAKGVVLNRMYTGSYLSTNLGHEVINMFQADDGKHYLYLNAKGNYAKEHEGLITDMLLVRYAGEGKVEVLAWAKGLNAIPGAGDTYQGYAENSSILVKQSDYISKNKISYGNVDLIRLFEGADQQNVYITYLAEVFYRPQKPIYIQYVEESEQLYKGGKASIAIGKEQLMLNLSGYQFGKATLKQYIYPNEHKNGKYKFDKRKINDEFKQNLEPITLTEEEFISYLEEKVNGKRNSDWEVLGTLLDTNFQVGEQTLWIKDEKKSKTVEKEGLREFVPNEKDVSLFDIMPKLQRDENCFSDALKFFIDRNKEEWQNIFTKMCGDNNLGKICSVKREEDATISTKEEKKSTDQEKGGRIDLLIRTENALIVIENKIKSGINSKSSDEDGMNQLDRYKKYVEFLVQKDDTDHQKNSYFFVLFPDYNMPDMDMLNKKGYLPLYYSALVGIEKATNKKDVVDLMKAYHQKHKSENLWSAFYDAMKRHSYDNENESLYEDMKSTFFTRIKNLKKKKMFF